MDGNKSNTTIAGIDVGKRQLDAAVHGRAEQHQVANDAAGWEALVAWLGERGVERVGLEATGGYDPKLGGLEDWDFWLACAEHGFPGRHVPGVLFEYRRIAGSRNETATGRRDELVHQIRANHPTLFTPSRRLRRWHLPTRLHACRGSLRHPRAHRRG